MCERVVAELQTGVHEVYKAPLACTGNFFGKDADPKSGST